MIGREKRDFGVDYYSFGTGTVKNLHIVICPHSLLWVGRILGISW